MVKPCGGVGARGFLLGLGVGLLFWRLTRNPYIIMAWNMLTWPRPGVRTLDFDTANHRQKE